MDDMTRGPSDVPLPLPPPEPSSAEADGAPDIDPSGDDTGVAALLAALPDPGPMPEDVSLRIEAALRAERLGAAAPVEDALGEVVPLQVPAPGQRPAAVRRPGRRWGVVLAAAAGGVFAVVVGQSLLAGLQGGSATTAGSAPAPAAAEDKGTGGAVAQPEVQGATSGSFSIDQSRSGTAYTSSTWLEAAGRLKASPEAVGGASGASWDAVQQCLTGLRVGSVQHLRVDLGTFDGAPAIILVLDDGRAFAVQRTCRATAPGLLATGVVR